MPETPIPAMTLKTLRRRVQAIEGLTRAADGILPLGPAAIDQALPWGGLPLACLHHVVGHDDALGSMGLAPSAAVFVAALTGRLKDRGTVVWCLPRYKPADTLYGPALAMVGLDEQALVLVRAKTETEALWAMEESLGCADVAAVVGALTAPFSLTAGRRLQLAAERGGTTGFLLQPGPAVGAATAAVTRWRVGSLPSVAPAWPGLGRPRWSLTLERCRQGLPRSWIVEWCDETRDFRLAEPLHHRSVDPVAAAGAAGALCAVA